MKIGTTFFTARSNGVYLFSCTVKSPAGKYLVGPLTGNRNKNLMARKLVTSTIHVKASRLLFTKALVKITKQTSSNMVTFFCSTFIRYDLYQKRHAARRLQQGVTALSFRPEHLGYSR